MSVDIFNGNSDLKDNYTIKLRRRRLFITKAYIHISTRAMGSAFHLCLTGLLNIMLRTEVSFCEQEMF